MKNRRIGLWMVLVAIFGIPLACGDTHRQDLSDALNRSEATARRLQSDLDAARGQLERLRTEHLQLVKTVTGLQNMCEKLELEAQICTSQCDELKQWSRQLADGYGPGIWYMDETTLPAFALAMPSADPPALVTALNSRFAVDGLPKIRLLSTTPNEARIRVEDVPLLTERMGSHGARSYINAVLYTLASIEGIECVVFEFKEGAHAVPGQYCR